MRSISSAAASINAVSTMSTRRTLVDLDLRLVDEFRPARVVLAHLLLEQRRARVGGLCALLQEFLAQRRGLERGVGRRAQPFQERSGYTGGGRERATRK